MGAPITGMIVLGVVQTLLALSTISPTLSEQFSALVNLAVVTNVIPYVVSLSALIVMMKRAKVAENVYTRNVVIGVVAMAYSVFALYASGKDAVMGGMLVLGVAYIIWGFLAPRFNLPSTATAASRLARCPDLAAHAPDAPRPAAAAAARSRAAVAVVLGLLFASPPADAATVDRIKDTGHIRFGYLADARRSPCARTVVAPDGYAVELCQGIAEDIKTRPRSFPA